MDTLSRLIALNPPRGRLDRNCILDGDWQLPHAAGDLSVIRWHVVITGSAWLDLSSGESRLLENTTMLLLPQSSAHRLRQHTKENTQILCGSMNMPISARHFLTALPEVLVLSPENASVSREWFHYAIKLMQEEVNRGQPGAEAICSQMCGMFLTFAIRGWLQHSPLDKGLLQALLHTRLGEAVAQMLEAPHYHWTVESLAQIAHMSRASFAEVFRQVSGTTPLSLLTTLRMQLAAQLLAREAAPLVAIAELVGYANESSFHKAFVRHFGCTPGQYRNKAKELATHSGD
ncbi:reactive chlorine-specific transcriptional regulator RclR [Yersinia sp. J1]|uniref:reactive chlorine-specific transcriptional regulator RclR n=1 Tax=Yersinia sp. J1 TaxID=3424774 RepID=UPI003D3637E0